MPSCIHQAGALWLSSWVNKIINPGDVRERSLDVVAGNVQSNFEGDYENS